jgi:pantoate--beta-alanine ligase
MDVIKDIETFRRARAHLDHVGLVPTMGYLHDGHLSLVRQCRAECRATVVSIFVNPAQFGPREDFGSYPRDMERDLQLLRDAGVDLVFTPTTEMVYPPLFNTYVNVYGITELLEGVSRPVFFRGVTTIVCKLLNIVQPARTYFGQKDAQQCVVVRKMVKDLNIPTEIVICPTVREPDGLAMSSRNAYLAPAERQAATVLYRALSTAAQHYQAGERSAERLRHIMREVLAGEPLAHPDYVSASHPATLHELEQVGSAGVLLSLAVQVGPARLIDNILLPAPEAQS